MWEHHGVPFLHQPTRVKRLRGMPVLPLMTLTMDQMIIVTYSLWLFNIDIENGPFIDDF